ncbi:MAG: tetratricopeptide repeat protein [Candidatus Marinimicrobia bacterium]|nr:tetratricopeptide repeat protein [Candidatus Neomarinimicrobiota bacterium]
MNLKKVLILTLCVASLFSFAIAQDTDTEALQQKVEEARNMLENFDAATAQELLNEILAQDSTFAPALFTYHNIELMYGNLSEAQALVRKAIEFSPSEQSYRDKFDELRDLINQVKDAQREVDGANYDAAKRIYNELIEKNPSVAEIYYRLGFVAIQEEDYDTARDNFDKSSILAPSVEKYAKAKNILAGKILQEAQRAIKMGDMLTAERKTLTSLRINPEFGSAYSVLGYIKLKSGDISAAIENMEKAIKYNPTSRSAWYNLGSIYRKTKQYEKAENALLEAIALDPGYAKSYTTLGQTYAAVNKVKKAEENFKKSIALASNSPAARESYGELLNNQERYAEAIVQLTAVAKLISQPSKKYLTNYRLAFAYNRSGEYRKALDVAKEVTTAKANFGGGWYELGVAYAKLGDKQNAINAFNKGRSADAKWRSMIDPERERLIQGKELSF